MRATDECHRHVVLEHPQLALLLNPSELPRGSWGSVRFTTHPTLRRPLPFDIRALSSRMPDLSWPASDTSVIDSARKVRQHPLVRNRPRPPSARSRERNVRPCDPRCLPSIDHAARPFWRRTVDWIRGRDFAIATPGSSTDSPDAVSCFGLAMGTLTCLRWRAIQRHVCLRSTSATETTRGHIHATPGPRTWAGQSQSRCRPWALPPGTAASGAQGLGRRCTTGRARRVEDSAPLGTERAPARLHPDTRCHLSARAKPGDAPSLPLRPKT